MDLFDTLAKLGLVTFSEKVSDFLGLFELPLLIILNMMAVAIVFVTVIRLVFVVMSSLTAMKEAGSDDGSGGVTASDNSAAVLKTGITSMVATIGLALAAYIAVTQGVNILYSFATGFTAEYSEGTVNQIEEFLGKGTIFARIALQIQGFAQIAVVLVGGFILARTLFGALGKSKYEQNERNQFEHVQLALKRAGVVGLLTVVGFFSVAQGPNVIFGLLKGFQSSAAITPVTPPVNSGGGATPTPAVTPTPTQTPAATPAATPAPTATPVQ